MLNLYWIKSASTFGQLPTQGTAGGMQLLTLCAGARTASFRFRKLVVVLDMDQEAGISRTAVCPSLQAICSACHDGTVAR